MVPRPGLGRNVSYATVLAVMIIVHMCMLLSMRIFPMADLPFHLAVSTIHKYYGDPANHFAEYYSIDLFPRPNCFHPIFCALKIFPSVEFGNRVYYGLYIVLLPLALVLVIKRLGGNLWISLLSLLLLYNLNFRWGFVGYTMAIPFVILALYFHLRSLTDPRPGPRIAVAVLLVGIFFMHLLASLLCILSFSLSVILHNRRSARTLAKELLPLAPVAALMLWWIVPEVLTYRGASGTLVSYYRNVFASQLADRADLLFVDQKHLYKGMGGKVVGALFSLCIIGPLVFRLVADRVSLRRSLSRPQVRSVLLFLFVALFCYVFLPGRVEPAVVSVNKRMSVYVLAWSIALLSALSPAKLPRLATAGICVVVLAHALLWGQYFRAFGTENRSFTKQFLSSVPRDKTMATIIIDWKFRGEFMYRHFGDYHIVWNLGIVKSRFTQFPFVNVKAKEPDKWPQSVASRRSDYRRPESVYSTSDYILVRSTPDRQPTTYLKSFHLEGRADMWTLYGR